MDSTRPCAHALLLRVQVRESLLADPDAVRLRDKSPHFYETGLRLSRLCDSDDAARLPATIQTVLATRVTNILSRSLNSLNSDVSDFVNTLTDLEQTLFWQGYRFVRDRLFWKKRLGNSWSDSGLGDGGAGSVALGIGANSKAKKARR